MTRVGRLPRVNPFSTRFVQPGAIPFRFPTPDGLAALARRLIETDGWGEIVGQHGSGKSTLLAALVGDPSPTPPRNGEGLSPTPPSLAGKGVGGLGLPLIVQQVRLNTSERILPAWVWDELAPRSLLAIDGFEQLGYFTRRRVKRHCRRHGCGLLVTAHCSMGLPTLQRTDVTPATAVAVVAELVPPGGEWVLEGFDIATRLRHHRGSLREVLFELYDRWESGERGA
jgi:hypothetical protein